MKTHQWLIWLGNRPFQCYGTSSGTQTFGISDTNFPPKSNPDGKISWKNWDRYPPVQARKSNIVFLSVTYRRRPHVAPIPEIYIYVDGVSSLLVLLPSLEDSTVSHSLWLFTLLPSFLQLVNIAKIWSPNIQRRCLVVPFLLIPQGISLEVQGNPL